MTFCHRRRQPRRECSQGSGSLTGDNVIGFSKGEHYHSEDDILHRLAAKGFDPDQITALYSERQPCPTCKSLLGEVLRPGTPVSWSVPWGGDPVINQAANDLLANMIRQAGG